jgi:hypothetical protein
MISPNLPGSEGGRCAAVAIHSLPKWLRLNPSPFQPGPRIPMPGANAGRFLSWPQHTDATQIPSSVKKWTAIWFVLGRCPIQNICGWLLPEIRRDICNFHIVLCCTLSVRSGAYAA